MYTENQIEFTDELINKTGFYLWMHSVKCKRIRIGFYIAMAISGILCIAGLLRKLGSVADWTMALVFFVVTLVLFIAIVLIWPLVYRSKVINGIHRQVSQIVTMDTHYVNLHTSMSHEQYKWHTFTDIEDDEDYYFLFSPSVYIILDKDTFPEGGEEIFRNFRTPARLLKSASRKSKRSMYLMLFTKDYLTPLVKFFHKK